MSITDIVFINIPHTKSVVKTRVVYFNFNPFQIGPLNFNSLVVECLLWSTGTVVKNHTLLLTHQPKKKISPILNIAKDRIITMVLLWSLSIIFMLLLSGLHTSRLTHAVALLTRKSTSIEVVNYFAREKGVNPAQQLAGKTCVVTGGNPDPDPDLDPNPNPNHNPITPTPYTPKYHPLNTPLPHSYLPNRR